MGFIEIITLGLTINLIGILVRIGLALFFGMLPSLTGRPIDILNSQLVASRYQKVIKALPPGAKAYIMLEQALKYCIPFSGILETLILIKDLHTMNYNTIRHMDMVTNKLVEKYDLGDI